MSRRWLSAVIATAACCVASVSVASDTYQGFQIVRVVVNGKPVQSDVPAINVDGRTLLPVRAVAQAFGARVEWNEASQTVTLSSPGAETTRAPEDPLVKTFMPKDPKAHVQIKRLGFTGARGAGDRLWVAVTNTGTDNITNLDLNATITDAQGLPANKAHMLGSTSAGYVILAPGDSLPAVLYWERPIDVSTQFDIRVSADTTVRKTPAVEVTNYKAIMNSGSSYGRLVGTVVNHEPGPANITVYAVVYDGAGIPVDEEDLQWSGSYGSVKRLDAGATSVFENSFVKLGASYRFWVGAKE